MFISGLTPGTDQINFFFVSKYKQTMQPLFNNCIFDVGEKTEMVINFVHVVSGFFCSLHIQRQTKLVEMSWGIVFIFSSCKTSFFGLVGFQYGISRI